MQAATSGAGLEAAMCSGVSPWLSFTSARCRPRPGSLHSAAQIPLAASAIRGSSKHAALSSACGCRDTCRPRRTGVSAQALPGDAGMPSARATGVQQESLLPPFMQVTLGSP